MAIGAYFRPASMSADKYNEVMRRLDAAGAGHPDGRQYHVCFGAGDGLQVFDIWESQEKLDKFFGTLSPILQEVGVDPGEPMIEPVQNTRAG